MEAPKLKTWKRSLAAIAVACVVGMLLCLFPPASKRSVKLLDGSILKLEGVSYGTNEFVVGRLFERAVYKFTRRRLGSKILGIQFCPPVVTPSGPTALALNCRNCFHFHFTHTKGPPVGSSLSGNSKGVTFNGTLIEVFADNGERLPSLGVMGTCCSPNTAYGRFSFELPAHEGKFFCVQFSRSNESGEFAHFAQISVKNPAPIRASR